MTWEETLRLKFKSLFNRLIILSKNRLEKQRFIKHLKKNSKKVWDINKTHYICTPKFDILTLFKM